jgi:crotonobetaine/carnitine-CoA ligase
MAFDSILSDLATSDPRRVYATESNRRVTRAEVASLAKRLADALAGHGIGVGSRVLVALPNSIDHVAVVFALFLLRATWVPVNVKLDPKTVALLAADCHPTAIVYDRSLEPLLMAVAAAGDSGAVVAGPASPVLPGVTRVPIGIRGPHATAPVSVAADSRAVAVMYTSGTTGRPKGVQVLDTMLIGATYGAISASGASDGDRLLLWEPMYHIGGAQMLLVPLLTGANLHIVPGFSASGFWSTVVAERITQFHYLGGILDILMAMPRHHLETEHVVKRAWGGGARGTQWQPVKERFAVEMVECYGLTETSSIVTTNHIGAEAGLGTPLPWFEVSIEPAEPGAEAGEIVVHERVPGLVTPGYLGVEKSNGRSSLRSWHTSDQGWRDARGNVHFLRRDVDRIRVRGEIVSAQHVEDVLQDCEGIAAAAAVGVPAPDVGEEEILAYVQCDQPDEFDLPGLLAFATPRLAPFEFPRYVKVVSDLPRTPTQRVAKHLLDRTIESAVDISKRTDDGTSWRKRF